MDKHNNSASPNFPFQKKRNLSSRVETDCIEDVVDILFCFSGSQFDSPVMIRSPTKTPIEDPIAIEMRRRLDDEIDFRKGPWMSLLHSLNLPPYSQPDSSTY